MIARNRSSLVGIIIVMLLSSCAPCAAQEQNGTLLTIDRIFNSTEFDSDSLSALHWLADGSGYTVLEPSAEVSGAKDIVRYNPANGKRDVVVSAQHLVPQKMTKPILIEEYSWSPNQAQVLIFTNSQRVWRQRTRGDYWVFDVTSLELRKLGGDAKDATLMFAKFSPDGKKVAYVREKNVYVEDLVRREIIQLTKTEKPNIINGTFDWVYEEELNLRDGIRWSPDSSVLAFWQLDTSGVGEYYILNNTIGIYQKLITFEYPKAGTTNSSCRVGAIKIDGKSDVVWMKVPGDPREHYIARMEWTPNSDQLLIQQLNRKQNTNTVMLGNFSDGEVKTILTETDEAWVDVHDAVHWLDKGNRFTWLSERDGWRHIYLASRVPKPQQPILVTPGEYDVIDLAHVDEKGGWIYYYASPDNATQQYLYRSSLDGQKQERVTPADLPGTHTYDISSDCKWAIHTYSAFEKPPVINLIQLPSHSVVKTLVTNKDLRQRVQKLKRHPAEFFKVDIGDGVVLDGWCIKPYNFDPAKKYPVLVYVYGEPAGQTVLDTWMGSRYLWHLMMAQKGFVVISVDNRGTPAPRGRQWRKIIYRQVGILAPRDQANAVKALLKRWPWMDAKRVGIWGWSGGGSMSLHAIFRYPELYNTAMSVAPVSNERYYDTIYQERYMGLPQDNPEGYKKGSPITYARQLKGNLLIVHGTADDNVHYANTELVVNELIAANKQFTMMAYPNRTHSISEGRNTRRHLFTLLTNYLMEKLSPDRVESEAKTENPR